MIAAKMQDDDEHQYFEEQVKPLLDGDIVFIGEVDCETTLDSGNHGIAQAYIGIILITL